MKIFITGATGLVGGAITRNLLASGHEITALRRPESNLNFLGDEAEKINFVEGDILDSLGLLEAMDGAEIVVHAAAIVNFEPGKKEAMHHANVRGTANVVNAALQTNIRRFCHISSVAALGRPNEQNQSKNSEKVIDETQRWVESTWNSTYSTTKYQAEMEVRRGEAEGLEVVLINPSLVLGEGDLDKSSTRLFKYVLDQNPFYTKGLLNYVDVRDVAAAVEKSLTADVSGERFILSAGAVDYQEFFTKVAQQFSKKAPSYYVGPGMSGLVWRLEAARAWLTKSQPLVTRETAQISHQRYIFDGRKAAKMLGVSYTPLEITIARVCESFELQV